MRTFLAEKPSQGRDIAKVLGCNQREDGYLHDGNGTCVTWCVGHLVSPADPHHYDPSFQKWRIEDLPIIPERWKLKVNPNTKGQLEIIQKILVDTTELVLSTDADREGECIGKLVLAHLGYQGEVKRLWLSALDETSIKKALNDIRDGKDTDPLFWAGLGRSRADWICGFNYTRAATLLFSSGAGNVFSVGRVQTPTLRLVVERDLEIENFKPKDFYTLKGVFAGSENKSFNADWLVPESAQGDEDGRCLKKELATAVKSKCEKQSGVVTEYSKVKKAQSAPLPFALSALQIKANNQYGYDAQQVLTGAQALYEKHKATTYPRSDSGYLPVSQFEEVTDILNALIAVDSTIEPLVKACDTSFKARCWDDKKLEKSSHHAIIPTTNQSVNLESMSEIERNLYDLIRKQYIAQFLGKYDYHETNITVEIEKEAFKTKGVVPLNLGWKKIIKEESEDKENELPVLNKGDKVDCSAIHLNDRKTTAPKHYTDATLLSAMKNAGRLVDDEEQKEILRDVSGIGTEATRANIIDTILNRHYLGRKGKSLISSEKGREIISILPDELSSISITALWEQKLDEIANGKGELSVFLEDQALMLKETIGVLTQKAKTYVKKIINPCPECKAELIRYKSKKSPKSFWWGCSDWKDGCKGRMADKGGKPVAIKPLKIAEEKCPDCGKELVQRSYTKMKKKKVFWACRGYPECKKSFNDSMGKPQLEKTKKGDKGSNPLSAFIEKENGTIDVNLSTPVTKKKTPQLITELVV